MVDKKVIIGAIGFLVIILIAGFFVFRGSNTPSPTPNPTDNTKPTPKPSDTDEVNLTMWGVFDENAVMQPLIDKYREKHSNVKITYVKKQYSDYESLLVDAIASEKGPDLLAIHNDWLPKHEAKLAPAPDTIISLDQFNSEFVPSAYQDFTDNNKIFALPLYTDNLALFYNKQLLNKAEIYNAPTTWDEVISYAKLMTKTVPGDPTKIAQAGIAMGTASNINRPSDILLALMYQTQTPLISDDKRTYNFNQFRKGPDGNPEYPGTESLSFYTAFATAGKQSYTWGKDLDNSLTAFANGKVGMMIGYNYMIPQLERLNPNMSYGIVKFPQIKLAPEPITISNYWGWGVSRTSANKDAAWEFLRYLSNDQALSSYLSATGRISPKKIRSGGSVFEQQAQYAKTIYKGNAEQFDTIFSDMINDVIQYNQPPQIAIDTAARKANEMIKKFY
ncbi:MAG: sugar ABC transporter substrate-binding protein [Patescibacteria group bacterium]